MYTVDRIENDYVVLENRNNLDMIDVKITEFNYDVSEGDIVLYKDGKYIKDEEETKRIESNIRSRFNKLKKYVELNLHILDV